MKKLKTWRNPIYNLMLNKDLANKIKESSNNSNNKNLLTNTFSF